MGDRTVPEQQEAYSPRIARLERAIQKDRAAKTHKIIMNSDMKEWTDVEFQ
jgi:hypothetical protein